MSDLYDKQHDAEIVRLNDRITKLEASLADSNEALQVMGLKLEQAEADIARLRVDAERLSQYFSDEEDTYSAVGDYLDNAQPDIGDTFELTKCYAERKPTRFRVISRGLDITGEPIIDVEEVDEAKSHSANTVGGPTTVQGWPMPQVEPASDHDKIVSWNWVLRSIENNPDHAVIISRTPVGLCFTHGNPVPELEDANELLRDALKELVELKDMKEILDANESTPLKAWSIEEEYRERKPKAWALARAVLNDTNPVMDAAPACER